jgi:group I intron endonuclease
MEMKIMNKISGVYKITNNITGDFYIGSSRDIKHRWAHHKKPSVWKDRSNNPLYIDMQKYGLDKFTFEIIELTDDLLTREQYWMDNLRPIYNNHRAIGQDADRYRKWRETHKKERSTYQKEWFNRFCLYNGEKLTLRALYLRFRRQGITHPNQEARKYLIET